MALYVVTDKDIKQIINNTIWFSDSRAVQYEFTNLIECMGERFFEEKEVAAYLESCGVEYLGNFRML